MTHDTPLIQLFGEVLFDYFPDGSRILGGAPFNAAWHLQAFGQAPRFISRIGNDPAGKEIAESMAAWGMSRYALQTDPEHPTGSVQVSIINGEPHYDIVADCAYDFIDGKLFGETKSQGILYHGTLAIRHPVAYAALQKIKAGHEGKIFVDVNLRPPWWEKPQVQSVLNDAHWVKLNEDELNLLCPGHADLGTAMKAFTAEFDLDTLVVTLGAEGAVACDRQLQFNRVRPSGSTNVIDTVGAGDAFASVLLLALAKQWPFKTALERAQEFAAAIVGRRGATVTDKDFYRTLCKHWH